MVDISYVSEPPARGGPLGRPPNPTVTALIEAAQQKPGVWAEWRTDDKKEYQRVGATLNARKNKAYSTPGRVRFEVATRSHPEGGFAVYVRWPETEDGDE